MQWQFWDWLLWGRLQQKPVTGVATGIATEAAVIAGGPHVITEDIIILHVGMTQAITITMALLCKGTVTTTTTFPDIMTSIAPGIGITKLGSQSIEDI